MRSLLCVFLAASAAVVAQTPGGPTIRSTTTEVLLDLVVRDKKAHIVRDLRPEEIQVFEDGVPQKIRHFELFERGVAGGAAAEEAAAAPAPTAPAAQPAAEAKSRDVNELRQVSVVSVLLGPLTPDGRKLALDAMRDFVKTELGSDMYVGVFSYQFSHLRNVQPYTNEPDRIMGAMERALMRGDLQTNDEGDFAEEPVFSQPAGPRSGPAAEIEALMATHWVSEMHDLYQGSIRQLLAIRNLVQSQEGIPGRKIVILFWSGLTVHPDTAELLKATISAANRSNVTIYAVDTKNYMSSDTAAGRTLLNAAAHASWQQQVWGGDQRVTADQVLSAENAMASINANTRGNLITLSRGTGGDLLPYRNFEKPLHRALEEVRTHYELTYSPTNAETDGGFRNIQVKISRPGVTVFSRSGYYALPTVNGHQIYPFEMLTMKALNTKPPLSQFGFHAVALRFRPGAEKSQCAFAFEMPARDLTITREEQWATVHLSITALLKDENGQVADRVSKDIHYQVPAAKIEDLRRGAVTFTAPFLLAPGRYTVEIAAVDRQSMKASVRRSVLVVPESRGLNVSDVTLVRRVDAIGEAQNRADPLELHGGRITPELSDTVTAIAGEQLRFYAVAYPPAPHDGPVELGIEITHDGETVLRAPAGTATADPTGAAPFLVSLPAEKLTPGEYDARLTFRYGGEVVTRQAAFTVAKPAATN